MDLTVAAAAAVVCAAGGNYYDVRDNLEDDGGFSTFCRMVERYGECTLDLWRSGG